MRICFALMLASLLPASGLHAGDSHSVAVASMETKLRHVENNGVRTHPDVTPTQFTEAEANAYLASGKVELPAGVQSLHLQGEAGVVNAVTQVDFDRFKGDANSFNPLLAVFSGIHQVVVVAHAHGAGGAGFVHVDSVSLDGVEIPHFALELFVEKYLQPKYPDVGLDSKFQLPDRIANATVGEHTLTVVQK